MAHAVPAVSPSAAVTFTSALDACDDALQAFGLEAWPFLIMALVFFWLLNALAVASVVLACSLLALAVAGALLLAWHLYRTTPPDLHA